MDHDRPVIGRPPRQHRVVVADETAGEAAVEPQGQDLDHRVGRLPRPDIAKARDQRGADDVVVAEHRRPRRQFADDAAELTAVQHLAVRQVDVGDAELSQVEDLADPVHQGAGGQRDHPRRRRPGFGAPHGEPVDPPRQGCPGIVAADPVEQEADGAGRLLHQQQVGLLLGDQGRHVVDGGAGAAQQVPAHDLERRVGAGRLPKRQIGSRGQAGPGRGACSDVHRAGLASHHAALPPPPRCNARAAPSFDGLCANRPDVVGPIRRVPQASDERRLRPTLPAA